MFKKLARAAGISSMLGIIGISAWADTPPPPPPPPPPPAHSVAIACKQDIETLCPDIKPGEGRLKACFKSNYKQLSPGCKESIKANRKEH